LAAVFFAVFGSVLMFTIEADGFADISNAGYVYYGGPPRK
jgi:hypothetical protein